MDVLSKKHQIEIETASNSWLNLSPFITEDIIIQDSALSFGVIKSTCNIRVNEALAVNIDIRRNWAQWARGKDVRVQVKDSGGNLHPVKALFILKASYDDGRRALGTIPTHPTLSLELGDILSHRDTRDLATDDNGVQWSGVLPMLDYANQWLTYFGLPTITQLSGDPIPNQTMRGPITYSGGSKSEHIGKILYGYGRYHLYSDHLGRLRLCQAQLNPSTAYLDLNTLDLPVDRRSPTESEMPAGVIHITGTPEQAVERNALPCATSITTTRNLKHTETICTSLLGNTETTTRTGRDEPIGISVNTAAVAPKNWTETITRIFGDLQNVLQSKTILRTESPTLRPGETNIGQIETKNEEYTYTYDGIVPQKIAANIKTKPPQNPPSGGGSSVNIGDFYIILIQEWVKRYSDLYTYLLYEARPTDDENAADPKTILAEGENQPPATQFRPSDYILKTLQITGSADFSSTPGIDAQHQRTFGLGAYCPNSDTAEAIAEEQGAWLIGRYHGQNLAYPIGDEWLINPPPPIFNVFIVAKDNIQDVYLLNAHALFLGETQSYGGGAGLWLGTRSETGEISPSHELTYRCWAYDADDFIIFDSSNTPIRFF